MVHAVQDLLAILPMLDETVVLEMRGADVHAALENGGRQYPKLEGRFLQVPLTCMCLLASIRDCLCQPSSSWHC